MCGSCSAEQAQLAWSTGRLLHVCCLPRLRRRCIRNHARTDATALCEAWLHSSGPDCRALLYRQHASSTGAEPISDTPDARSPDGHDAHHDELQAHQAQRPDQPPTRACHPRSRADACPSANDCLPRGSHRRRLPRHFREPVHCGGRGISAWLKPPPAGMLHSK
jgi:hypothetical protein